MKQFLVFSLIPIAVGCNKAAPPALAKVMESPPTSSAWSQISGTVQFEDKCSVPIGARSCVKITGGEDLNDTNHFYMTENDIEKSLGLSDNQHVTLIATLDPPAADGSQVIGEVQSIEVLNK